jgi:hypothetical protein
VADPIARLLGRLDGVRRSGEGWVALCPGHEDRHASLSVAAGDDGRALLTCHTGCRTDAVAEQVAAYVEREGLRAPVLPVEPPITRDDIHLVCYQAVSG